MQHKLLGYMKAGKKNKYKWTSCLLQITKTLDI